MAGSARRQADATADASAAAALARSDKDRREHAIVADFILDTLAPSAAASRRRMAPRSSRRAACGTSAPPSRAS
ncbi:chorismate-binding protein [Pseudoroseomonas wenyumeiae]